MRDYLKKAVSITILVVFAASMLVGCMTHEHIIGTGAATGYTESAKQWYLLWGLMPLNETGLAREADVARAFPVGSDVEVVVLEVDPTGRRIRVSHKAVLDAQEADELRAYNERADAPSADGFGSLADKLRSAFEPRKR